MIKLVGALFVGTALAMPVHDAQHLTDWIQNNNLSDPLTKDHCCGENDCSRLSANDIIEFQEGFVIRSTGEWIEEKRVIWRSNDGAWWRCAPYLNGVSRAGPTRCLIGPPRGV